MSNDIQQILDILTVKKSRNRWRWVALLALIGFIIAIASMGNYDAARGPHVARVEVSGIITGNERQLQLVRDLADDKDVKAMILRIDSPGGTTVGSEALYDELRKFSAKKPVVAVMDSVAASGGYITALAADRIYARGNTITGSIGVIFTYPDVSQLLTTVGVKMEEVKSGELKAEPSGTHPVPEKARVVMQEMVNDGFVWFKGLVAERRKLDAATVDRLSDGRVYSGRQALQVKLIDALGTEEDARDWLAKEKGVSRDNAVLLREPPPVQKRSLVDLLLNSSVGEWLGLDALAAKAKAAQLDGMLVLWRP